MPTTPIRNRRTLRQQQSQRMKAIASVTTSAAPAAPINASDRRKAALAWDVVNKPMQKKITNAALVSSPNQRKNPRTPRHGFRQKVVGCSFMLNLGSGIH